MINKQPIAPSFEEINYAFNGAGNEGLDTDQNKKLFRALQKLPKEIIDFTTDNLWFVSSNKSLWGYCVRTKDLVKLKAKALIFLSQELWRKKQSFITHMIAHEIAHAYLNHKAFGNPQQEKEADKLANRWLK